jgi:hypothetical protein
LALFLRETAPLRLHRMAHDGLPVPSGEQCP